MNVLVTGWTGFLGGHVVVEMLRLGHRVLPCSRSGPREDWSGPYACIDLAREDDCELMLDSFRPEAILHLAGDPLVKHSSTDVSYSNIVATHNLLEHAPEGCFFLLASSAAVYGTTSARNPAREDDRLDPHSVYGATKASCEHLVSAYHRAGKVRGASCRFVAMVGRGTTHGAFHDLHRKLMGPSPSLRVLGQPPGPVKPMLHASDAARAVAFILRERERSCGAWNVSPPDALDMERFCGVMMNQTGVYKPLEWEGNPPWAGDQPEVWLDGSKLRDVGFVLEHPTTEAALRAATRERSSAP